MDPCQNINDHPHNRLPRVDDLKGDQPTCRKIGKQSPDIKIDDLVNEDGKCIHEYRLVMVSMVWLGTYAPSAPHYNQNRLAKTIFHSRLAFIHDWLSFAIGQRRWLGLVSVIAKTADYDQKQSLESPCRFAYI